MKREYPESPLVGGGAVIVDRHLEDHREDKRVLLIRRGTAPPVGGDLKAGSDAADVRWFTRDELPALNLAYDANDVVLKGLARTMERRASSPGQRDARPHTSNS